ncbi:MAG: V-type H(+)-translocating pyrophosphatase [Candidatus Woesearchaeota archaeon]|jgi:K(+)-stimulated pyrophosphate-energized sodium pump|nr:V-type H(+)-translocating pyrophosphatase [Candidatus Woesearchaeota archaeon]
MIELIIVSICVVAFILAIINYISVQKMSAGDKKMKEIANYIAEGAKAFLIAEYKIMFVFIIVIAALLWFFLNQAVGHNLGLYTAIAFVAGSIASILSGAIGMIVATKANVRTTEASKKSVSAGFDVAFKGGSVLGLTLVSFAVLGLIFLFMIYSFIGLEMNIIVEAITGFGLGGSMMAMFGRVGGGIYTKAADVGADIVGKVEKNIPEDDPRNPAVIADNVGDNVGDIAGMGSDLFGSVAESTAAALVIGFFAFGATNITALTFPILISAVGILASIITLFFVKVGKNSENVEKPIKYALVGSTILMAIGVYFATMWAIPESFIYNEITYTSTGVYIAILGGLVSGLAIGLITEYYTSASYRPVKKTAEAATTGAGTLMIDGLALGYESAVLPVLLIAGTAVLGFHYAGLYGIALSAIGMLGTLVIGLTIDVYGPISDNAGGIAEMAGLDKKVRKRTDILDAAGNTTAAIGKGFAIGSAALTSLALFSAFVSAAGIKVVNILDVNIIAGVLVGAMLPFLFSAMTMKSVGKAAQAIVVEVRRQFKEIKGLMEGKAKPDYEKCIAISTKASLNEMLAPSILIIVTPVFVGVIFGVEVLAGVLAGSIASGIVLAISMANSGGAWDNAKKYIEAGNLGGKGSDNHKAAIVGDTVGDPFKDTSGPALNILVKLMAIISLVLVPLFI